MQYGVQGDLAPIPALVVVMKQMYIHPTTFYEKLFHQTCKHCQ